MWILEHSENGIIGSDITFIIEHSGTSVLKLLFVDTLNNEERINLRNNNFIVFDREDAKAIAGGAMSSFSIPMNINEIGGVITVLEYEKIISLSKNVTTTYYLFSGLNAGLNITNFNDNEDSKDGPIPRDSLSLDDQKQILGVYCPNWNNNEPGIVGFFEIEWLERKTFEELLKEPVPADSAVSKEDLHFYQVYSEKERVCTLKCGQLYLFEHPLPILDTSWISEKEIEEYLNGEIMRNGNNSTYLDLKSCRNLIKIRHDTVKHNSTNKFTSDMILETIAAAVSILADSIPITDAGKKQISYWKSNLSKNSLETERNLKSGKHLILIQAHIEELDALILQYTSAVKNSSYFGPEKKEYCRTIASKSIDLLNQLEPFQDLIQDYNDLSTFFLTVMKA